MNQNRITLTHDNNGRLTEITHSSGDSFTLQYDNKGLISSLTDHTGDITKFYYDNINRLLKSVRTNDNLFTNYTYKKGNDGFGLSTITYPSEIKRSFKYDTNDRLISSCLNSTIVFYIGRTECFVFR